MPFFGGDSWFYMVWMLNMNAAIFGVLSIIPTYLSGKEAFGKRAGILAALLLAVSAASLSRSHATIAVHDSWTLFFVICAFYFYLRALKTLTRRRWVDNWFQRSSVQTGLKTFFQENRKSVLYAFLAGLSVGVTALSWQGWAYVPVILTLIFLVEVLLDRIRNQDAMGVTILFMIILATPLLISFPWYAVRNLIHVWWDVPFYLFLVAAALGVVFTVTRDYPWTLVIPGTFLAGGVGLLVGFTVNPALLYAFYSGAGYFVKTKVYSTIAEAQEPGMSELILSFGMFTFGIGLMAAGWMIWQIPKRNNPAFTMLVLWTFGALFMAMAAARFIFNAAPVMALATGYARRASGRPAPAPSARGPRSTWPRSGTPSRTRRSTSPRRTAGSTPRTRTCRSPIGRPSWRGGTTGSRSRSAAATRSSRTPSRTGTGSPGRSSWPRTRARQSPS